MYIILLKVNMHISDPLYSCHITLYTLNLKETGLNYIILNYSSLVESECNPGKQHSRQ